MKKISSIMMILTLIVSLAFGLGAAPAAASTLPETNASSEAADKSAGKIVIEDQMGRTITFDEPPRRLATTIMPFPYIFHSVMGQNDYMVGCNPSSVIAYEDSALRHMYPQMAKAQTSWVDTSFVVNVEELLKLEPDVVFQWTSKPEEIKKMEAVGLKVIALQYGSIDDLETWIRIIAKLYQKEERGEELIDYFHKSVAEVTDKTSKLSDDEIKTIVLLSNNLKVSGKGFTNYWVEAAGGKNPAKELTGEDLNINMEQMLIWNPDVLFVGNFTEIQPSDLLGNKLEGQDWSLVKAVKDKRVYKIPIGGYRWDPPGTETPLTIKWVAKMAHPELFKDMDIKEEVKKFFKEIYQFDLTEEMLSEILDDIQN